MWIWSPCIYVNLYVTNALAYLIHTQTTNGHILDSVYKVRRDATGTRPVHVSWLSIVASRQGGITKSATVWKHIYVGLMELT